MRLVFLSLLMVIPFFLSAQEKSVILSTSKKISIQCKDNLLVTSKVEEKRQIFKSKNTYDYTIRIYYNNFIELDNIKGKTTQLSTGRDFKLPSFNIGEQEHKDEEIFHSDSKKKVFQMNNVIDNSIVEYSYNEIFKEPHLLSPYTFQSYLETKKALLTIELDAGVELGYMLYGNYTEKIKFLQTNSGQRTIYTWEATDIPAYEPQSEMISNTASMPHVVFFIKSYMKNGTRTAFLDNTQSLFDWYNVMVKNINLKDKTALKIKAEELVKGKSNVMDKAEAIYYWVQKNLTYVAFEYEMGGFIPRDASDVFEKKYGDCKDMANLLTEMLSAAKINSSLTWIGTRSKPYSYSDISSPSVDNHMIASFTENSKRYFLDATDRYCPFGYPTIMIQGKEALIRNDTVHYVVEKVPITDANLNKKKYMFTMNLSEQSMEGKAAVEFSGYCKSEFLNELSLSQDKEAIIWKSNISDFNSKIDITVGQTNQNAYNSSPLQADYTIQLQNWIKTTETKWILKPILMLPFRNSTIELEKRKFPIDLSYCRVLDFEYIFQIPDGLKLEFKPENGSFSNDLASFNVSYSIENNTIKVAQQIVIKQIAVETTDFRIWNDFIKELTKQYNQSMVFEKTK